jgi:hypothetical protein
MRSKIKIIVVALTLTTLLAPSKPALAQSPAQLIIWNVLLPNYSGWVQSVHIDDSGSSAGYMPPAFSPCVDIYALSADGSKYTSVGLDISTNNIVMNQLAYCGNVPSGSSNALTGCFLDSSENLSITSTFPSNILITSKTITSNYTSACDLINMINTNGYIPLPNITNAVDGAVYGTNWVAFTRKDSSIPQIANFAINQNGTVTFTVSKALPGEYLTPQYCTNLTGGNWISNTNCTTYVPVTLTNFGQTDSAVISNVPALNAPVFYRIKVE